MQWEWEWGVVNAMWHTVLYYTYSMLCEKCALDCLASSSRAGPDRSPLLVSSWLRATRRGWASRDRQVHCAFDLKRNSTDVAFERLAVIQLYPCTGECANWIAYLKGTLDTPQVHLFSLHCTTSKQTTESSIQTYTFTFTIYIYFYKYVDGSVCTLYHIYIIILLVSTAPGTYIKVIIIITDYRMDLNFRGTKLSRMAVEPWKPRKFSTAKIKVHTVYT